MMTPRRSAWIPRFVLVSIVSLCMEAALAQPQVRSMKLSTLTGEVIDVRVPNDIHPGDRITGSVVPPKSKDGRPSATLEGAVVEVQGERTSVDKRLFSFAVPAGLSAVPLLIRGKDGRSLGEAAVPVRTPARPAAAPGRPPIPEQKMPQPARPAPGNFAPMYYSQPGKPLTIAGNFDGDGRNTRVEIGGRQLEVVAESPRASYHALPEDLAPGRASVRVEESGARQEFPIQVLGVGLTSDRTTLLRNQRARVTVEVTNIENLNLARDRFRVELTNLSPATVRFRESTSNMLSRDITSQSVRGGTYRFNTNVVGVTPGSFTLQATVTSSTCTACWDQYEKCANAVAAREEACYRTCDKAKADTGCYLACSTAARAQELECFAEYVGCFRKKLFGL